MNQSMNIHSKSWSKSHSKVPDRRLNKSGKGNLEFPLMWAQICGGHKQAFLFSHYEVGETFMGI